MTKCTQQGRKAYLISFIIPVMAMILIFIFRGIFPFGQETFLRTDMYHQYAPFFSEFHHKLRTGGSLLYSWDVGLGINFSALYAYYLASPLNWLLILCPKGLILEFMTYMIVVKIGLAGVSMCYYLRRRFPKRMYGCCFIAILYAMSGYISAYSWNLMWLDCIVLFPLIMLGLEKLVRGESGMLYVITLGLSILSNYYISIMTCIFMVIYFICLNVLEGMKNPREVGIRIFRFAIYSLIAGGLAAVTLLPEIFALQMTASSDFNFPQTATQYFAIIDMFARHMPFVETEQGLDHWPNIYAGGIVFLLLPLYFMNRKISIREKVVHGFLLVFFYLSFSVNILNFIWHGFHYPNSLPCRQSFIYIFLILVLCYEAFIHRDASSVREVNASFGMAIAFCLIAQKVVTDDAIHFSVFYLTALFVLLYYYFLYTDKVNRLSRRYTAIGMLVVISVEATLNMAVTSVTTTSRTAYVSDNKDVEKLVQEIRSDDDGFYRFEKVTRKTKDDGAWMNFPSVSLFSSTAYAHCSDFFKRMGMEASTNAYSITGSTPLMNMLMSVKYGIYSEEPQAPGETGLSYVAGSGTTSIYETDFSLPAGYMLSEEALDAWSVNAGTPALAQNSLCEALGCDPVLISVLGEFYGADYTFTADQAGEYYAYVSNALVKQVNASYGYTEKNFNNVDRGFFLELGYLEAGETVTLHSKTEGQSVSADVYRFDYNALREVQDVLQNEGLELTSWKDTKLGGTMTTENGGMMMTSIPYDPGWKAFVDGVETDITEVKDTFIGIELTPGTHTVELRFMPQGLTIGGIITALSLVLLLAIWLFTRRYGLLRTHVKQTLDKKAFSETAEDACVKPEGEAEEGTLPETSAEIVVKPEGVADETTLPEAAEEIDVAPEEEADEDTLAEEPEEISVEPEEGLDAETPADESDETAWNLDSVDPDLEIITLDED